MILELNKQILQCHPMVLNWIASSLKSNKKNDFSVNLVVLLMINFVLNLISSILKCTFTSLGIKKMNIKLSSLILFILGGNVYPLVDASIFLCLVNLQVRHRLNPINRPSLQYPYILLFLIQRVFHV